MTIIDNLLVGKTPEEVLIFGPNKMFIDEYLWFEENAGIVVAYQVKEHDTEGHFGILRGVDMIEIFGQAGTSACTALEGKKQNKTRDELAENFRFVFLGVDQCRFSGMAKAGEILICFGKIRSYRFRQMTLDGSLYKVPNDFDYHHFFNSFSEVDFQKEALPDTFSEVANFKKLSGRAIKIDKII
ncbi:MAG: hypothetical protein AAFZ15_12005 [Bacteroidota bacterium]